MTKRVGLIGAGYIADWHVQALRATSKVRIAAVCDAAGERAAALAKKIGAEHHFDSLDQMLEAKVCDSVHILVPPNLHALLGKKVLEAGVDAFIEKPLCLTVADCQTLIESARLGNARLAANHNFLFLPSYEKLKSDVVGGVLGKLDHVTVNWQFPLGQLENGPFHGWLFEDPTNVLFEIAPHAFAFVVDLVGPLENLQVRPTNSVTLPGNRVAYRRWQILGDTASGVAVAVNLSFVNGFPNRRVEVRGSNALAVCDYERDVYVFDTFNSAGIIFEPQVALNSLTKQLRRQARENFWRQAKSTNRLAPFGLSITRAIQAFYNSESVDARLTGEQGRNVIQLVEKVANIWRAANSSVAPYQRLTSNPDCKTKLYKPSVLVLGGTGFIGRYLVDALVGAGHSVRVLSRSVALGTDLHDGKVQVMTGDLGNEEHLTRALDGITTVFHLARAYAKEWEDFLQSDVAVTKRVGEVCARYPLERFVYTGTIDSYDASRTGGPINETTGLDPAIAFRNNYARSKAMCESELMHLHRQSGLPLVIARPGIVIGKGGSPLHWGVGSWPAPCVCTLWGDGRVKLPLVLVQDCAAGLVKCMSTPNIAGESFNLIGDPLLTAREYLEAFQSAANIKLQVIPTPIWRYYALDLLKYVAKKATRRPSVKSPSYKDWKSRTQRSGFSNEKAKKWLGWSPETSLEVLIEKGIREPVRELFK